MDLLEKILRVATPIIAILVGYFTIVLKLQVRRLDEKIANSDKNIEDEVSNRKDAIKGCEDDIRKGLKNERSSRLDISKRHDDSIDELFGQKVSKDVCIEKHKWNGYNRRDNNDKGE